MNFHESTINPLPEFLSMITDGMVIDKNFIERSLLLFHAGGVDIEESDEFFEILKMLERDYKLIETTSSLHTNSLKIRKINYGE